MNTTSVDAYLRDGCGRCDRYQTPDCKVHRWTDALAALRELVLASELTEEMKWGCPCYTLDGKNVVMIMALNDHCGLSFFKGAALDDADGVLQKPGPNSRIGRVIAFTSAEDVARMRPQVTRLLHQAIAAERAGVEVVVDDAPEPMPAELEQRLAVDPALRQAFEALTPGRQRSHILYVSGAKQPETRERRAERCAPKITAGKGFNER